LLKADESTHIDQMVERLENEVSSSEIFAALFELELNWEDRAVAGEEFCEEL
jgi:DNA processing protein